MPLRIKSSDLSGVSLSSSLYQIVFFQGGAQEIQYLTDFKKVGSESAECSVFFRPDKLGPQEKYIQVKLRGHPRLELDITIKGNVSLLPKIEHLGMALLADSKKYRSQTMNS